MNIEDYVISKIYNENVLENQERILAGALRITCKTKFDGLIVIAAIRGTTRKHIAEVTGLSPQAIGQRIDRFKNTARQQAGALLES